MEGIKTLVSLTVHEVRLEGVPNGLGSLGRLSLCFQRGAKHSQSSKDHLAPTTSANGDVVVTSFAGETLSLVTTLVRDTVKHVFREKRGKLVLRRVSATGSVSGYDGIAVAQLPLHQLLGDYEMRKISLTLTDCIGCSGGTMTVTINPKFLGEATLGEDSLSQLSNSSDHSKSELADFKAGAPSSATSSVHTNEALAAALQANKTHAVEKKKLLDELAEHKKRAASADALKEELEQAKRQVADTLQQSYDLLKQKDDLIEHLKATATSSSSGSTAETEDLRAQLEAAAAYVAYQETQINALKASAANEPPPPALAASATSHEAELEDLRSKVDAAKEYIDHQEGQIAALTSELEESKTSLSKLAAELEDSKAQLAAAAEFVGYQEAQIEELKAAAAAAVLASSTPAPVDTSELDAKIDAAKEYIAHQEGQIAALSSELEEAKSQLTAGAEYVAFQETQIAELTSKLEETTTKSAVPSVSPEESEQLKKEIVELKEQLSAGAEYVAYQETQMATLSAELEESKSKLQQASDFVSHQEEQLATLNAELEDSKGKVNQAAEFIAWQEGQIQELTAAAAAPKAEELAVPSKLADMQERFAATEATLREREDKVNAELAQYRLEVAALKEQLSAGAEYVAFQEEQLAALNAELEDSKGKVNQAAEFIAWQEGQIQELTAASATQHPAPLAAAPSAPSTEAEEAALRAEIASLKEQLQQGAEYVAFQEEQLATLNAELEDNRLKVSQGAEYVAFQEEQLASLTAEVESLKQHQQHSTASAPSVTASSEQVAQYEAEIAALKEQLQQGAAFVEYQDSLIAAHTAEVLKLKAAVAARPVSAPSTPASLATIAASPSPSSSSSQVDSAVAALEKKLEAADAFINHQSSEIAKLHQQLGEGQQSTQYIRDLTSAEVQEQLGLEHKRAIELLAAEIEALKEAAATKDVEMGELREQLQESKGESETFKAARLILVKEIDSLKEAVKAASGEQAKAERAVQDLERKHAEAVSTRDSLANEKATLAGEISVLQANLDAAKSFAFPGSPTSQHLLVAPGTPGATGGAGDVPGALNESSIIMSSPMNKSREQEIVEFERERAEHEQIVGNLIETKMALAINNSELDEEKLKVVALQKRLQAYTSKISSLEERLVENMEKQKSSRGVFLFRRKQQQHDAKAAQQKQQRGGRVFEDDDDDL